MIRVSQETQFAASHLPKLYETGGSWKTMVLMRPAPALERRHGEDLRAHVIGFGERSLNAALASGSIKCSNEPALIRASSRAAER